MADEVVPNVPLLRKAVEWVEEQANLPEIDREWDQDHWMLDADDVAANLVQETAIAMFRKQYGEHVPVMEIQDFRYVNVKEYQEIYDKVEARLAPHCKTAYCVAGYVVQSQLGYRKALEVNIGEAAEELLGLTEAQANTLFQEGNTAEDVRTIAEKIAGERL